MKNVILCLAVLCLSPLSSYGQQWNEAGNTGITPATKFIGTTDNTPIPFRTVNVERMRLYPNTTSTILGGGSGNTVPVNQSGFLGLGLDNNFFNGPLAKGPYSLLHINGQNVSAPQQSGYRVWMKYGISFTHNGDFMYVGPKAEPEGNDRTRAVIAWSDNAAPGGAGPDDFSFLFTDSGNGVAGNTDGREIMRLAGAGNVGIGNFQSNGLNQQPTHRLDVAGQVRIREVLPIATPADTRKCILVGDDETVPNDFEVKRINFTEDPDEYLGGDGIWHDIPDAGADCDWAISPFGHVVTGVTQPLPQNWGDECARPHNVGIGNLVPDKAKLSVILGESGVFNPLTDVAIEARNTKNMLHNYGIDGRATGSTGDTQYNYGGYFRAQNSPRWNYAVYGDALSNVGFAPATQLNVGIYGTASGAEDIEDNWAGYFDGKVFASSGFFPSDEILKENITDLSNGLEIIAQLNPKVYNYRIDEFPMHLPSGERQGFMAQELQEILPSLVTDVVYPEQFDEEGELVSEKVDFLGVSYIEIIPILTAGIQEQQTQIENLNARVDEMEALLAGLDLGKSMDSENTESMRSDFELYQNRPNPFSTSTEIVWRMAEEAQARIIVHNQQGITVASLQEGNMGKGLHSIEWQAGDLPAGTYFYSLEVNGQLMVKRAIKLER